MPALSAPAALRSPSGSSRPPCPSGAAEARVSFAALVRRAEVPLRVERSTLPRDGALNNPRFAGTRESAQARASGPLGRTRGREFHSGCRAVERFSRSGACPTSTVRKHKRPPWVVTRAGGNATLTFASGGHSPRAMPRRQSVPTPGGISAIILLASADANARRYTRLTNVYPRGQT